LKAQADALVSRPDPAAVGDAQPIEPDEIWENPMTREREPGVAAGADG
jgi:hypothetical protein